MAGSAFSIAQAIVWVVTQFEILPARGEQQIPRPANPSGAQKARCARDDSVALESGFKLSHYHRLLSLPSNFPACDNEPTFRGPRSSGAARRRRAGTQPCLQDRQRAPSARAMSSASPAFSTQHVNYGGFLRKLTFLFSATYALPARVTQCGSHTYANTRAWATLLPLLLR